MNFAMTLKEFIESLEEQKQYKLALILTERALCIWNNYTELNKPEYRDSVVGMYHAVRKDILFRTLETIKKELANPKTQREHIDRLREEFSDPIVAMQDLDWELPYPVERIFYAIRNFLDKLNGQDTTVFGEPQIYTVINQAIDALETAEILTEAEIKALLMSV